MSDTNIVNKHFITNDSKGWQSPCPKTKLNNQFVKESNEFIHRNGKPYFPVLKSEKEARREKLDETIQKFVDASTCHGFKHCFNSGSKVRQLIWMMILAASVALLVQKLYESGVKFLERPFSTKTTLTYVDQMEFPAISICNMNDMRNSKVVNTTLGRILEKMKVDNNNQHLKDISPEEYSSTRASANHEIKDMLYTCIFQEKIGCNHTFFTAFAASQGERCYKLNSSDLKVTGTGRKHSLIMELNIEQYDYFEDIKEAGIKLIIHDQNETPVRMAGVKLSPGFSATVQIKKKKTLNLKAPYATNCGSKPLKYFDHYSTNTCWLERLTDHVVTNCNCKDSFMPGHARVCSIPELMNCTFSKWEEFDRLKDIQCPIPCESQEFESSVSFARYPSNKLADKIAKDMQLPGSVQENREFIRDNYLRVEIFYEEMSYIQVEQTPSYDLMILLGDIGGQFGLFLGSSIITYVEFFDFFAALIYTKYFRIFKPPKI
ncbi:acid-sensing ion channel 1C [Hydra vulgaris]|uniref:Acid-sensing ion channel 1C n=1 Tax=Hydra vulgaris TaxID=6087 RepID=A0ABM4BHY3_HYDVU